MNLHHVWAWLIAIMLSKFPDKTLLVQISCAAPSYYCRVTYLCSVFCDSVNYHRDSSRCFLHSNCIVCFNYSCMHHSSWTLRPLLCILLFSPPKLHSVPSMLFIWGGAAVIKKGYLDPSTSSLSQEAGYSFPLCGQWTSCCIDKKRLAL